MMSGWSGWIGREERRQDIVTPALLARWNATFDAGFAQPPQGLHWALATPEAPTAALGADGHPLRSDDALSFLPPIPLPRRMWAESQLTFHHPLPLLSPIERRSRIAAISEKTGASGALAFVTIDHDWHEGDQRLLSETQTLVYRAADAATPPAPVCDLATQHWDDVAPLNLSEAMLFRFSALTFNSHRIHYDHPYAREVEGYAGLVVHGPLLASLMLQLLQLRHGPGSVTQFRFRARRPLILGEPAMIASRAESGGIVLAVIDDAGTERLTASAALAG